MKKTIHCSQVKKKFPDYLTEELPPETAESIREHVADCTPCRQELEELTTTWTQLNVLPEEEPGPNLRKNFYTMLESYNQGRSKENTLQHLLHTLGDWFAQPRRTAYQAAFTVIILIIGFTTGLFFSTRTPEPGTLHTDEITQLRGQVQQMRQQLALAMLDQPSPSRRLKGIAWSSTVENPGEKTLNALLNTLNNDPDVNVRLSTVDALYLFSHHPMVKKGIVDSLPTQTSPLVQVALIDLMVGMREKKAADALKQLIQKNKLNPDVKKRAELVMKQMI